MQYFSFMYNYRCTKLKVSYKSVIFWKYQLVHFKVKIIKIFIFCTLSSCYELLIHSANPKWRTVGIIVFAHVVRTSVPLFIARKTKQQKTMFATGLTMGLAEWINDDTSSFELTFTFQLMQNNLGLSVTNIRQRGLLVCVTASNKSLMQTFYRHIPIFEKVGRGGYRERSRVSEIHFTYLFRSTMISSHFR